MGPDGVERALVPKDQGYDLAIFKTLATWMRVKKVKYRVERVVRRVVEKVKDIIDVSAGREIGQPDSIALLLDVQDRSHRILLKVEEGLGTQGRPGAKRKEEEARRGTRRRTLLNKPQTVPDPIHDRRRATRDEDNERHLIKRLRTSVMVVEMVELHNPRNRERGKKGGELKHTADKLHQRLKLERSHTFVRSDILHDKKLLTTRRIKTRHDARNIVPYGLLTGL